MGKSHRSSDVSTRKSVFDLLWSGYPVASRDNWNRLAARCLTLLFINLSIWILAALMFKIVEGGLESSFKCGVKRVRRDFIETLWNETRYFDESDWKSSARRRLIEFENELHQAVEAGIHSYSGQTSWNLGNAFIYSFSVASTIGYSRLSPSTATGRLLSVVFTMISNPIFFLLLLDLTRLTVIFIYLASKYWTQSRTTVVDSGTDENGHILKKESNLLTSKLTEIISNWKEVLELTEKKEPDTFEKFAVPPVLSGALLLIWSTLTSLVYSATFLSGPADAIYAILTPATTVGYADTEHEDSFFFLLTSLNLLLGLVLYFIYQISLQGFLRKFVDLCLSTIYVLPKNPDLKTS